MRVTYSGEFIHAAPWSVGSQGNANVSHGCTGMSTANADWLYHMTMRGDVVEYTGTDRPMTLDQRLRRLEPRSGRLTAGLRPQLTATRRRRRYGTGDGRCSVSGCVRSWVGRTRGPSEQDGRWRPDADAHQLGVDPRRHARAGAS